MTYHIVPKSKYEETTLDGEILYSARINKHNSLVLYKWGGHKEPVDMFTITQRGKGKCDCLGSMRNPMCKHKKMVEEVAALQLPWTGAFYDYNRKLLYIPEDGEGIPLQGAADIKQMAINQGVWI